MPPVHTDRRQTAGRIVIIGLISLAGGLLINWLHPGGIPPRLLLLALGPVSRQEAWKPVSADSARFLYLQGRARFIDIRPKEDFQLGRIESSVSIPFRELFSTPARTLYHNDTVCVIYDFEEHSEKAVAAVRYLLSKGCSTAVFLRNGYAGWLEDDFPAVKGGK